MVLCSHSLRLPGLVAGAASTLLVACSIRERIVEERAGAGGTSVLGSSTGSGGGGTGAGGLKSLGGAGGAPSKVDPFAPDPLFPQFENGDPCDRVVDSAPTAGGADAGTAGAGGDSSSAGCGDGCTTQFFASSKIPTSVVLDSTDVFWADPGGYVIGMPVDRTGGTHLLARLDAMATGLALDATSVYAQTATSVLKLARASGVVRTLASDQVPRGIAVDGAYVYWLSVKARAEVRRMSLARGTGEVLAELDEAPLRIALDDQNVYVLGKADVLKLPKCQTGEVVLASTSGLGGGLAVDAGYVYWSDGEVIQRTPRDGGSVETLTNAAPLGDQFVVGDSFIYWGGGSGVVVRMPASGGAPQVIADGLTAPVVYAVDAHSVYFVDTNEIRKVDR